MVRGWWWIKDPEELYSTLQALHPRGVREKVLHKHLAKHMETLAEMCTKPIEGERCVGGLCVSTFQLCFIFGLQVAALLSAHKPSRFLSLTDPMFELKVEEKDVLLEELQKPWQVQERAMEADISVLKLVEDLEQRVVSADLHLKVRNLQRLIVQCLIITHPEHKYCGCCFVEKLEKLSQRLYWDWFVKKLK